MGDAVWVPWATATTQLVRTLFYKHAPTELESIEFLWDDRQKEPYCLVRYAACDEEKEIDGKELKELIMEALGLTKRIKALGRMYVEDTTSLVILF